ncbi:GNAT family N-acetyltransferase [Acidipropionibacterium virtanenii]|uniref:Mycothiol acetyltransferase n=1 Tax=Acidipropionibacterium virtanenii TaxID=2057246 RepID=A0A344UVY7_9ACTN|nr:GNAT family N-acetyltransferase [Acidipropionibacterium virtanenii]AXE39435.1 Mycothiol acetyltransferase [Acidipropionibacterium virtanenii]
MATTRTATSADLRFMVHVLCLAVGGPSGPLSVQECHDDPVLAHYLDLWTPSQIGLICSAEGRPVGACWLTLRPAEDPGLGYVAPGIPELIIGIAPDAREQGHGSFLLASTLQAADAAGVRSVSLAVDAEDLRTAALFQNAGFTAVGHNGDRTIMLRVA